ncbi:MAG TPA: cell division protein FtsZ [Bacilli bacterium]|jgi:cell division protein FtsZ|nr:cell division protein FtsZ [Bacilli bacterium]HPY79624.1 cell division protein FtsZ [Bacilli bacterium]HQA55901.1 cell division protein FtsZ [Bacilli bacterium]
MENYDLDNFEPAAKIVVIGVGGAGNNAVNRMIDEEINNVEFWVANTDKQALSTSKSPHRLILGQDITGGLGAGGEPEIGEKAAEASAEDIKQIVAGANMVFVAAGMGGGTGTGAAPVIARIAKDAGALVVAIVTRPFTFEGKKRIVNSIDGLNKLKSCVDSIIVVSNDKLLMTSGNAPISEAFCDSDKVLTQSVKTIVNLILLPAVINLDFADVRNTLKDSGVALIGFGMGSGANRAKEAASNAINSPLLEASIRGARRAIVAVTCGKNVSLFDAQETVNLLIDASGHDIDVKFGVAINDQLSDEILVSVIASDFEEEINFTVPSPVVLQKGDNGGAGLILNDDSEEDMKDKEKASSSDDLSLDDDILPSFLKD